MVNTTATHSTLTRLLRATTSYCLRRWEPFANPKAPLLLLLPLPELLPLPGAAGGASRSEDAAQVHHRRPEVEARWLLARLACRLASS